MIAGLMLRRLFAHNQENFTGGRPIIPAIAIIEEAQSVLGRNLDDTSPFVEWVKEGRKYDLGAILVTQQPGAMASELLSQADNWFCFHLLSEGDARTLGKYNSHYSDDVLAHLIGEPIQGNCFMWCAPHQPFVLPVRIRNYEELYRAKVNNDPHAPAVEDIRAKQIVKNISEALVRLSAQLKEKLSIEKLYKLTGVLAGGADGIGLKSGRLYYLIQEIKTDSDTMPDDTLKHVLMVSIFGEGAIHEVKNPSDNTDYFCATLDAWRSVLGKEPTIRNDH